MKFDWLIAGAGFTGITLAERLAMQLSKKVLIVEKRDHIGGNAYDEYDEHGILIHRYGPHIFHANSEKVWRYLSQFTQWRPYYHHVLGVIDGQQVPIPFNLNSLYTLFPPKYAQRLEQSLINQFGFNIKVPILKLRQSANDELKFLADYIYEKLFLGYTTKMWDLKPEDLDPAVTGRVPVYISRDNRYFQDSYQSMPKHGYTAMFRKMIKHPNIKVLLNTDYREIENDIHFNKMIYTGPIDTFFDFSHGKLPYRSLHFEFFSENTEYVQKVATVNYPNEHDFTRITEQKHLTGQISFNTTLVKEFPQSYEANRNEPYYPIPREENRELYRQYQQEAKKLENVYFAGRLADYKYYNMDQAVGRALSLFEEIKMSEL